MTQITHARPFAEDKSPGPCILLALILAGIFLSYSNPASAIGSFKPTPGELTLLPPYCGPRAEAWGNDASHPEVARWMKIFGNDYIHMHHYCIALLTLHYGQLATEASERSRLFRRVVGQIQYVADRVSAGFILWPEMLHNRARAELGLGDTGSATRSLQEAITRNANYAPPYAELSDLHVSLGQREEARKVLETGLGHQPNSRLLLRKMTCLDNRNTPGCR